jgi:succinate dehydrogenase/fumarate reductase flavoprotein subunit
MNVDVIVVGAGLAGLMAALSASRSGARVCVLSKGRPNSVEIVGFNVPLVDPGDSPENFFEDTMLAGEFGGQPALVAHMAGSIIPIYKRLEAEGLDFRLPDGTYSARLAADNRLPRTIYHLDQTGPRLLRFLRRQAKSANVKLVDNVAALQILRGSDGAASGVLATDGQTGRVTVHSGKAVILAAGGMGGAYGFHTNSAGITGDSYAMAYLAGCELVDMEFVQFEPFIMVAPPAARGYAIPTTLVTNDGARVTNKHGTEVLPRNTDGTLRGITKWEMSRAMFLCIRNGEGTPEGGVWFDCRKIPSETLLGYPRFLNACKRAGVDPSCELLQVAPAAHNCMGGIRIDISGRTNIPGLFACGEAAGGLHGGNRMAGNSGPDCMVYGDTAGRSAATWASSISSFRKTDSTVLSTQPPAREFDPKALRTRLGQIMWKHVGVARSQAGLNAAIPELRDMVRQASDLSLGDLPTTEFRHLAITSLMVATAASLRCESRGAHFRLDYPKRDDRRFYGTIIMEKGETPHQVKTTWQPLSPPLSPLSTPEKE